MPRTAAPTSSSSSFGLSDPLMQAVPPHTCFPFTPSGWIEVETSGEDRISVSPGLTEVQFVQVDTTGTWTPPLWFLCVPLLCSADPPTEGDRIAWVKQEPWIVAIQVRFLCLRNIHMSFI